MMASAIERLGTFGFGFRSLVSGLKVPVVVQGFGLLSIGYRLCLLLSQIDEGFLNFACISSCHGFGGF